MQALVDLPLLHDSASLAWLAAIYTTAAVFSGLSGFGFSAIGSLSLAILPPQIAVAVLMGLSLITQASSFGMLWGELREHVATRQQHGGLLPYLAGGTAGVPVGLAILSAFGARYLTAGLGLLLMGYAAWSLFKPASLRLGSRARGTRSSFLVGAIGGVVGGFSAFPSSALVVWNGLIGSSKEEGRALTQPFVLWMQVVGLALLLATRPQLFGRPFWAVFLMAAPAALLGNRLGVAIYRRTGDLGYRCVTFIALGISGLGLMLKVALA
jgi:uncharacterized membrane protein YfcA